MWKEPRRARRIRQTLRVAARRRSDHLQAEARDNAALNSGVFGPKGPRKAMDTSANFFNKNRALCCTICRSRRKGRPKVADGICKIGHRDRIYANRQKNRRLANLGRRFEVDWEADDVVLLGLSSKKGLW